MMYKILLSILFIPALVQRLPAQQPTEGRLPTEINRFSKEEPLPPKVKQPARLGIDFLLNDYGHTLGQVDHKKKFGRVNHMVPGVAISYTQGLNQKFHWSLMLAGSFPDSILEGQVAGKKHLLAELNFLLGRKFANEYSRFQPFAGIGMGASWFHGKPGVFIPAGIGLETRISPHLYSTLNAQYRLGINNPAGKHFFYSIGVAASLETKPSKRKAKPAVFSPSAEQSNFGTYQAITQNADRDRDGVPDTEDHCPDQPGFADNKGCPAPPAKTETTKKARKQSIPEIRILLNALAKDILFETNSHVIRQSSHRSLDQVIDLLTENPEILLEIQGHTDDIGSAANNLTLSQKRAEAVVKYLVAGGVMAGRLEAAGYGESKPIAENESEKGRALNRRVELKIR